ncbi:MAG: phosphate--AMP phosphotransferase, partial [Blautia sp.]
MLRNWTALDRPKKEELNVRLKAARRRLYVQQMKLKEHKLPVLVLMEGWSAAGKGSLIGKVIKNIDPRFFKVATMEKSSQEEERYPFLHRYFAQIPEAGSFTFLDSGWMNEICME